MTQEEKLKEAKRLYKTANSDQRYVLESLFPELKESDDEKIRKSLIELFKDMEWDDSILHDYNMDKDKTIAWLEKQGEQKSTDKIQIGKEYKCIASPKYSTFMRGKIYKPEDKFLCSFMNFCSDCFEPIEDSKLKFKPGDRVRNKKSGLEQTLGGCIVDVYEGAFPFRIKDQDEWELVDEKSSDKVESKFEVGDKIEPTADGLRF